MTNTPASQTKDPVIIRPDDERLEALAEFAAGAGHEINNPLATISGRVQLLLRTETDPAKRQALSVIGGQVHRIRDMIGDAMLFGRTPEPVREEVNLADLVDRALSEQAEHAERFGVMLERGDGVQSVTVFVDRNQFLITMGVLLRNSIEAIALKQNNDNKTVCVHLATLIEDGTEFAELTITDSGVSFSDTDRIHLFDPFYSGRQAGRGLGFGLCKAWQILKAHQGQIMVESVPGETTTLKTRWPVKKQDQS